MNYYGKSDIGKSRKENQDALEICSVNNDVSLFIVCDGVGGSEGGANASRTVCTVFAETVKKLLPAVTQKHSSTSSLSESTARDILLAALNAAQEELRICADQNPDLLQMATTIVAALWMGSCVYILNVGDSRAYIVASKQITQLTKDHSYVQELIDSGMISPEQADDHIHKNIITRSVGTKEKVTPDLFKVSLSDLSSYCLLLCTDGLTNLVSDEEIQKILSGAGSLRGKTDKLIGLANDRGGFDNITVLLLSDHN